MVSQTPPMEEEVEQDREGRDTSPEIQSPNELPPQPSNAAMIQQAGSSPPQLNDNGGVEVDVVRPRVSEAARQARPHNFPPPRGFPDFPGESAQAVLRQRMTSSLYTTIELMREQQQTLRMEVEVEQDREIRDTSPERQSPNALPPQRLPAQDLIRQRMTSLYATMEQMLAGQQQQPLFRQIASSTRRSAAGRYVENFTNRLERFMNQKREAREAEGGVNAEAVSRLIAESQREVNQRRVRDSVADRRRRRIAFRGRFPSYNVGRPMRNGESVNNIFNMLDVRIRNEMLGRNQQQQDILAEGASGAATEASGTPDSAGAGSGHPDCTGASEAGDNE